MGLSVEAVSMRVSRAVAGGLFALLAVTLGTGSVAWACFGVNPAALNPPSPNRAPAGSAVTVSGFNWGGTVQVRWDDAGGRLLATAGAETGSFSVSVTIPSAPAGIHYLVVTSGDTTKAVSLEVRSLDAGTQLAVPDGADVSPAPAQPVASPAPGSLPAQSPSAVPGVSTPPASLSAAVPGSISASVGRPSASRSTPMPAAPGALLIAPARPGDPEVAPSPRAAADDLWGGFASGTSLGRAPSLTDLGNADRGGTIPSVAVAMWLVVAGMIALSVGFALAELRRRRALA